ncbi:MAG: hypothetical protein GX550_07600 [Syntrophomonadaceae bacterium]|nr:hypothetical protein [Syntrophomonadaceae bacterium]
MNKKLVLSIAGLIVITIILIQVLKQPDQLSDVAYENEEYGFALTLDGQFNEDVAIEQEGRFFYFLSKEIANNAQSFPFGVVGRIDAFSKVEYTKEDMLEAGSSYGLKYLGENEAYYFGWAHATDVQVPPGDEELLERFRALENDFEEIIKTFESREVASPPEVKIDTGRYVGLADNNFFVVRISGVSNSEHAFKVFMISNKVRDKFESLDLQEGEEIKLHYIENEHGQNVLQDIERITN